jgi:hypothetical protein
MNSAHTLLRIILTLYFFHLPIGWLVEIESLLEDTRHIFFSHLISFSFSITILTHKKLFLINQFNLHLSFLDVVNIYLFLGNSTPCGELAYNLKVNFNREPSKVNISFKKLIYPLMSTRPGLTPNHSQKELKIIAMKVFEKFFICNKI